MVGRYRYTTTTTTSPRLQSFRGKTIEILSALSNSGGMTVREIADKIFLPMSNCWTYLRRGEIRGIFDRLEGWGWRATPLGISVLELHSHNNNNNIDSKYTLNPHKIHTKSTQDIHKICTNTKQVTLKPWQESRTEPEVVVVVYLLEHYRKTGVKWVWGRELDSEVLGIPPSSMSTAIAKLLQDGLIYKFKDPAFQMYKIGLTKRFLAVQDNI